MKISRRKFLLGVSLSALIAGPAGAGLGLHGSSALAAPTGKALINDGSSSQSFIWANILKCAHSLGPLSNRTYAWQAFLDSNGYPNNAPGNQLSDNIQYSFAIPPAWGTTPLVVSWKGTGAFYMQPAAVSNYSVTAGTSVVDTSVLPTLIKVTGTNVRIVFNFTTAPVSGEDAYTGLFLGSTTYSGFNSLIFCRQSDEAAVNANQNALNLDYVAMLKTLNPRTFRGLDISGVNNGNQSQFSQRAPAGAFSFFAERYPPECWVTGGTGTGTGTSGAPYVCGTPSGWTGLVDGATVQVQFTNANTGFQPVINIGSTGNIRITDLSPNDLNANAISAGDVWTLTYSSVYNYWTGHVVDGVNSPGNANQGGIQVRAPLEQHIAIANAANCNCWYNICHRMSPADGTAIAAVVLANLNSNLAFYPEFSNEVWNSQNQQTSFIENVGLLCGFTPANNQGLMSGYGMLMRRMMGAITTAWGGPNSRLRRVMGFQAYGDSNLAGAINVYRFQGNQLAPSGTGSGAGNATYNSFTGSANYTTSPNRPIDFADVPSYALYSSGGQLLQFDANYAPDPGSLLNNPSLLPLRNITGISKATTGVLSYASDPGYITGGRLNIQNVVGMTQINQMNVTVVRTTATTYSMFTDSSLATPVDTSGFTTYSSGGTSGLYPLISGLTAWADLFPTNPTSALSSLDTDIRSGSQYAFGTGILSQNGTQTLLDFSTNIYPAWETVVASYDGSRPSGTTSLAIECYEGAVPAGLAPSTTACTALGISTSYSASITTLLNAYKNSSRASTIVQDLYSQFKASGPHASAPGWYQIVGVAGPWALTPGDLYTLPPAGSGQYLSWNGNVAFN